MLIAGGLVVMCLVVMCLLVVFDCWLVCGGCLVFVFGFSFC